MDQVKLVNIGEPRTIDLPDALDECETQDFVYLPPEVMAGKSYRSRSDIYSLGLLCWELWAPERVFKAERKTKLGVFIEKQKEDPMKVPTFDSENPFLDLISGCVCEGESRVSSTVFVNTVKKIQIQNEDEDLNTEHE